MPKESEEIVVKKNNRLSFRLKNSLSVYLSIINQNKRLLILVVILLIIPVTVGLVLVQQEIRSRASGGDNYSPVKIRTAWINYKTGGDYDISDPELKAEIDKEVKNIRKQGLEIKEKLNKEKNRKYIFENEIDEKTRNVKKFMKNRMVEMASWLHTTELN